MVKVLLIRGQPKHEVTSLKGHSNLCHQTYQMDILKIFILTYQE